MSEVAEDRVLEVLVKKTETIKRELGSLSKVIDDDIERLQEEVATAHGFRLESHSLRLFGLCPDCR